MRTRNGDKVKKNGEEGGRGGGERERGEEGRLNFHQFKRTSGKGGEVNAPHL